MLPSLATSLSSPLPKAWKLANPRPTSRNTRDSRDVVLLRFPRLLLGRRPTVGPQTLDLLIGVRIPASQFDLANCIRYRTQKRPRQGISVNRSVTST